MLKITLKIAGHSLALLRRIAVAAVLLLMLAVAGLILVMRYSVLPDIQQYHNDITRAVSQAIGLDVEIGKIEADWHGLGPHLRLSEIRILDKQKQATLEFQRVDTVVSWMTLFTGQIHLSSLEIDQPELLVKRDKNGVLEISGVQLGGTAAGNNFSNMLLNQSRIVIRNARISWLDEEKAKPLLVFEQVNLLIENGWNHHRFAMRAIPPEQLSTQLDVRGDFHGRNFDELQSWSGEIFTQLDYANLAAWKTWLPLPDALKQGRGALRGWLSVQDGKINQLTGDLALVNVQTRLAAELPALDIRVLSGRLGWREVSQGLEVSTHKLSLKLFNNFVLQPTDIFLRLGDLQDAATSSGEFNANLLELEGLGKLMEYLPLEQKFKTRFAEFSPQGRVENLQTKWQTGSDKKLHYKVAGKFSELSLQRVGKLPGFSGLSGEVNGSESNGTVSVNSHNLKVDAPQIMPDLLSLDTLSAHSSWQSKAGEFEVKVRNVVVANDDLAGNAYGSYQTLSSSPGKLDLTVHLSRASVKHASKYIPLLALGKDAQTWLEKSLLDGQSNDFNLRLKGNLNDFPFVDNKKGIFKIQARVNDFSLEYGKEWPHIDNASAELLIQGKELEIKAPTAMTSGVPLKNVKVTIPNILSKELMLNISGVAEAENARFLAFIDNSPVRGYLDGFADNITAKGSGKLNLKLDIPLSEINAVKVAGNYHFFDSEVEFGKNLPTLRKVNGDLMFTESGATTQNIAAQILGGPAKLQIASGDAGSTNIKLAGRANFNVLREHTHYPVLSELNGEPRWNVDISVKNKLTKVLFTSDLLGLYSELPAPFAKHADETIPVRFEMNDLKPGQTMFTLQYGSVVNANLLRVKNKEDIWSNKRGIVNFGNVVQKADRDGLWLIGSLPHLSVQGWGPIAAAIEGGSGAPMIDVAGVDLSIQKLTGYGNVVNDLHIKANSRNDTLIAQLASREVNGDLSWQADDNGKLVARLKNLDLDMAENEGQTHSQLEAVSAEKATSNIELPVIDLTIDRLSLKGRQLGKLELLAQQNEQDYQLDHLRLSNPDGVLNMDGKWTRQEDLEQTQLDVKLDISNAGNVLGRAGYPNSVKNGSGKLEGTFIWPGSPQMYSSENLNGNLSLDTSKGQFMQIDPGIGKLLSILSLQALPKRITLDFEDVFSKGFEFDSIKGSADIKQGVIHTDNLKIEGSSAKVSMKGQIDLVHETQDLRVRIVPAVGNSIALITVLVASNPLIMGPAVLLGNKVLNDPLGQLVAFEYNVTGSWIDPKVEKVSAGKSAK